MEYLKINRVYWYPSGNLRVEFSKNSSLNIIVKRKGNKWIKWKSVTGIFYTDCPTIPTSDSIIPVRNVRKFMEDLLEGWKIDQNHMNERAIGWMKWMRKMRKKKTTKE